MSCSWDVFYNKVTSIWVRIIIINVVQPLNFFATCLDQLFLSWKLVILNVADYFKIDSKGVLFNMRFEQLTVDSDSLLLRCCFLEFLLNFRAGSELLVEFIFELIPWALADAFLAAWIRLFIGNSILIIIISVFILPASILVVIEHVIAVLDSEAQLTWQFHICFESLRSRGSVFLHLNYFWNIIRIWQRYFKTLFKFISILAA